MLDGKRILLVVSGGIAAYKCPEMVRRLKEHGARVRCILTTGGAEFVTALSLQAVSEERVYQDLFSLTDENEMGHIQMSREADAVLVAPATANIIAKMAQGICDDLATTALLAIDKSVLIAPAMNVRMWEHSATRANIETLKQRGVTLIGPNEGDMACGEYGMGRMSEPAEIVAALDDYFRESAPLQGRRAIVTSGPTFEAIDPVRFIGNRSSGKQGHAIAEALANLGSETILVSGPTKLPDPPGVQVIHVESARQMLEACTDALPADVAVCAAAVSDWRASQEAGSKMKKVPGATPPPLALVENPDVLATLSQSENRRPALVVGFAAETEDVVANADGKRTRKGCDWVVANDVSPATGTFDGDSNTVHLVSAGGVEDWPTMSKAEVGHRLAARIADFLTKEAS